MKNKFLKRINIRISNALGAIKQFGGLLNKSFRKPPKEKKRESSIVPVSIEATQIQLNRVDTISPTTISEGTTSVPSVSGVDTKRIKLDPEDVLAGFNATLYTGDDKAKDERINISWLKEKTIGTVDSEDIEKLIKLLTDKVEESKFNPEHILNDMSTLSAFLRSVVIDNPELADAADAYLVRAYENKEVGEAMSERIINTLISEFKKNPNRIITSEGLPYATGIYEGLSAGVYIEALFRTFRDEAFDKGMNPRQFRRALDDILTNEPWELYEGSLNNRGNITRSRRLKPVRQIVDMAIAKGLNYVGY